MKMHAFTTWLSTPRGKNARKWLNIALSGIILLILARAISHVGWRHVIGILPANPLFYLLFAAAYLIGPFFDWIIYRQWWPIGWRSISVFLRKRVMNESLFSYSGDTYLLVWISRVLGLRYDPDAPREPLLGRGDGPGVDPRQRPLHAIKDMAILSGMAGNIVTFLFVVLALVLGGGSIMTHSLDRKVIDIIGVVFAVLVLINIGILVFASRVMSLPRAQNIGLLRLHLVRVTLGHVFIIGSWIVALPEIGIRGWLLLGAMRMMIARLPLPNKELLFAALAAGLTGPASTTVAALMAAQGALHLAGHGIAYAASVLIRASGDMALQPAGTAGPSA